MIGLDAKIETIRARFASKLFTDVVGNTYASLGRAFIVNNGDNDIPKLQIASSKEYQEVLPNDNINGHSFFLVDSVLDKTADGFTVSVGIYFAVNLDILYPAVTERAVEYLHRDVVKQLSNYQFEITKITTGLDAFPFGMVKETDNLEPYYLCRFDTKIEYKLNCNN